jgi:hypothetical protein
MKYTAKKANENTIHVFIEGEGRVDKIPVFEKDGKITVGNPAEPYNKADGTRGWSTVVYLVDPEAVATKVAELMEAGDSSVYKWPEPKNGNIATARIECAYRLKVTVKTREDGTHYAIIPKYDSKNKDGEPVKRAYAWPFDQDANVQEVLNGIIEDAVANATPYAQKENA